MTSEPHQLPDLPTMIMKYRNYLKMLAAVQLGTELQSRVDGSDVVQETLLEATRDWHQFRGQTEQELFAWLKTILINNIGRTIEHHVATGKRAVSREISLHRLKSLQRSSAVLDQSLVSQVPSPADSVTEHELILAVADCIANLNHDHREMIMMRSLQGKSYAEIAGLTNRTEAACRMVWLRAVEQLRERFRDRKLLDD